MNAEQRHMFETTAAEDEADRRTPGAGR
ncbi:MAG: hypothetical protein M3O01_01955 [Pseudomonadota bacterium]|nr:hypothetical protein [Pseudomonadota bacterium]